MKKLIASLILILCQALFMPGLTHAKHTLCQDADIDYQELSKLEFQILGYAQSFTNPNRLATIYASIEYRNLGLKLWYKYPNDVRKYDWLEKTMYSGKTEVLFWKNIEKTAAEYFNHFAYVQSYSADIDSVAYYNWREILPTLKSAYFSYVDTAFDKNESKRRKLQFIEDELSYEFRLDQNLKIRKQSKVNIQKYIRIIAEAIDIDKNSKKDPNLEYLAGIYQIIDYNLLSSFQQLGLTINEMKDILMGFDFTYPSTIKWQNQKIQLFSLINTPFPFTLTTTEGNTFEFTSTSQKITLIDMWHTGCGTCIERMPYIKQLYNKYHTKGFEVISVCTEDSTNIDKIMEITRKIDASWPLAIIGKTWKNNTLANKIFSTYGFCFVPQLLLLDKSGRMIAYNNNLMEGEFESLLIEKLGLNTKNSHD